MQLPVAPEGGFIKVCANGNKCYLAGLNLFGLLCVHIEGVGALMSFFRPFWASDFLLHGQEKVTKEKATRRLARCAGSLHFSVKPARAELAK